MGNRLNRPGSYIQGAASIRRYSYKFTQKAANTFPLKSTGPALPTRHSRQPGHQQRYPTTFINIFKLLRSINNFLKPTILFGVFFITLIRGIKPAEIAHKILKYIAKYGMRAHKNDSLER
jgi:hypothetical protein